MKTVKGTARSDFNVSLVMKHLEADDLTRDELARILESSCHVVSGLRQDHRRLKLALVALDGLESQWS